MKTGTLVALAVAGLFALMACAWSAMFFFAGQAHVESVPLVVSEGRAGPPGPPSPTDGPALAPDAAVQPVIASAEVR